MSVCLYVCMCVRLQLGNGGNFSFMVQICERLYLIDGASKIAEICTVYDK